ncbi:MAG: tRNA preQ1(34) S-adenosylmethionine ribosyltransferase-isomerase QueA [Phycisphaerales bacterium]|nr:tRNA preQ1(34) S-adenosylmethionine ribosyltransferase-isomerase QueA [Phycisphaerales bacterium]
MKSNAASNTTPQSDLKLVDLDYPFSENCIATIPAQPRDSARMMVVRRNSQDIVHARVSDLPRWLQAGDQVVLNETKVAPARVVLKRQHDGHDFEGLLAEKRTDGTWLLMAKNSRKFREQDRLCLQHESGAPGAHLICLSKVPDGWIVAFADGTDSQAALEECGRTPLPPYIVRARGDSGPSEAFDRTHYRTTFGHDSRYHSVASPTAGLHFTPELLRQVEAATQCAPTFVTLEVGMGTFKAIETPRLADHVMHCERFSVSAATLARLDATRPNGRLVVVGTTTVRALESLPSPLPNCDFHGESSLFIQPGYQFKHVDALLTNFHLPRSTLLSLVGSLVGLDRLKSLYALAQQMNYRFYSYGDAMLIL